MTTHPSNRFTQHQHKTQSWQRWLARVLLAFWSVVASITFLLILCLNIGWTLSFLRSVWSGPIALTASLTLILLPVLKHIPRYQPFCIAGLVLIAVGLSARFEDTCIPCERTLETTHLRAFHTFTKDELVTYIIDYRFMVTHYMVIAGFLLCGSLLLLVSLLLAQGRLTLTKAKQP